MNLVFITHPLFLDSESMPRFAQMITEGMKKRGHHIDIWSPKPCFFHIPLKAPFKKWLGYIDQLIIFPFEARKRLKAYSVETLFVFTDHALGPWIPMFSDRKHVIHCHDFLAQRSARGEIPQNLTRWSGRKYQSYIHKGYSSGKNFISVSKKTQDDLHLFLPSAPQISEFVYNGLNKIFVKMDAGAARKAMEKELEISLANGYLMHVGGNQWYKNRVGVIEIYNAYRTLYGFNIPLLMIGSYPSPLLIELKKQSPYKNDIHILTGKNDEFVRLAYSGASLFLFPSLAEGFGWPIAEAMASGCPVITTNEAPMTEVAGEAAFLIPKMPYDKHGIYEWAKEAAKTVNKVLNLSDMDREDLIQSGFTNIERFDIEKTIDQVERIYQKILNE